MTSLHNDMGHLGYDHTLDLTKARIFWPRMATNIERKLKGCICCVCWKGAPDMTVHLVNMVTFCQSNQTEAIQNMCL